MSVHKEHEFLLRLEQAGFNEGLAQKVVDAPNNRLAKEMVKLVLGGGLESSSAQVRAREIMGANFFGIEEAVKHFGVNPSEQQLASLANIPFSAAVLEACQNTHLLVAVFPLSIVGIRGKVEHKLFCSHKDAWYNGKKFAKDQGEAFWQLVRKGPVPNSASKTWDEQQALLAPEEEVPAARVMVYAIIGHYLATGERLFKNVYIRCSDLVAGYRVIVGHFYAAGLLVYYYLDGNCYGILGVASARKFK
ncbi:MAG: hypothetical protein NTZ18_02470 [Candidatus Komeilibacteria bacterium]|nr:hypothetical protein [Candidatus Komeilibacteria bacterium]